MRFEFISNACGVFTSKSGLRLLTDPWLVDGVFEGSWCHCPKLTTRIKDLEKADGIYLSHIHPDHYDERTFSFAKDTPIFLLDHKINFLIEKLKRKGYTNLVLIKDAKTMRWGDFEITLFAPFVKHNYFPDNAEIGNLIDSAAVIESGGLVAFNANDNTPDRLASGRIKDRFGHIDLLMHNYNSAGPYPACFNNLTHTQKVEEHETNLVRNLEYMYANVQQMEPTYTLPFAGSYALGGRLHYKNEYLGTTTWDGCAS
jgi:UDP-MurNAc hydroxylase